MPSRNISSRSNDETELDDDSSTQDETIIAPMKDLPVQKLEPSCVGKKRKRGTYKRGKHKRKDYPKKALSCYNIFFKETRKKIITEHGKFNFQEMVRKIAALWKEITPEDKLRLDAIASRDLARYKREVSVYEQYIVEKSQQQSIIEQIKQESAINIPFRNSVFDANSVGVNGKTHHENDNDKARLTPPADNNGIRNPFDEKIVARTYQTPPDDSNSNHTLTSDELELAHRYLQTAKKQKIDVSHLNSKDRIILSNGTLRTNERDLGLRNLTPTEKELHRRNLVGMGVATGDDTMAAEEAYIGNCIALDLQYCSKTFTTLDHGLDIKRRIAQAGLGDKQLGLDRHTLATFNGIGSRVGLAENPATAYELILRERFGLDADSMLIRNQTRLGNHQNSTGIDPMMTLNQENIKNLVSESGMQFSHSGLKTTHFGGSDQNNLARNSFPIFEEIGTRNQGNQLVRLNELSLKEMVARETKLQKLMSMNGLQNPIIPTDAELQKRLAMILNQELISDQFDRSSQTVGIGIHYNESRLREERIREQELLMNGWNCGAPYSIHGELPRYKHQN